MTHPIMSKVKALDLRAIAERACTQAIEPYMGNATMSPQLLHELRHVCERTLHTKWPKVPFDLYLEVHPNEPTALNLAVDYKKPANPEHLLSGLEMVDIQINDDDHYYRMNDIRAIPGIEVIEVCDGCWLAVLTCMDNVIVSFAALEWVSEDDNDTYVEPIFVGEGTGGSLRELRHTWWGPKQEGYVFYLPIAKTIAVLEALKRYFDD